MVTRLKQIKGGGFESTARSTEVLLFSTVR
jgi:hypothetical protein